MIDRRTHEANCWPCYRKTKGATPPPGRGESCSIIICLERQGGNLQTYSPFLDEQRLIDKSAESSRGSDTGGDGAGSRNGRRSLVVEAKKCPHGKGFQTNAKGN
ncbi:hypothetical protein LIER_12462 [Lithospermum erythrorhizon]|uniref:Uncharacterized protein n=1 Tax=Lithospermum erythrorhizon TaxID=34254 RepID=A0AAV3PWA0_LITER